MIADNDDIHAESYEDEPVVIPLVIRKGIERNDQCPCNSGKKYKKCHIKADKGMLPQEVRSLMHMLVKAVKGVAVTQKMLDEYPDEDINTTYDEKHQIWRVIAPRPDPKLLLPKKRIIWPS